MLFYVFDLEEYVSGRDIYFDFASFAPGSRADTFDELTAAVLGLLGGDGQEQRERLAVLSEYFSDRLDGHSTERILKFVKKLAE